MRHFFAALAVTAGLGSASTAIADPSWDDSWPKVSPVEAYATGAVIGGTVLYTAVAPDPKQRWSGGILLDDPVRNAFRARTASGRRAADLTSDALLWSMVAWPFVDVGAVALYADDTNGVVGQMALISAESIAISTFGKQTVSDLAGRERPYQRGCAEDDEYVPACGSADSNRSFYSGHTALAVTGASLVCLHRGQLDDVYGGRPVCVVAASTAATVGLLRIVADRHYLSDVLVGGGLGLASGLLLPRLAHYRRGSPPAADRNRQTRMITFRAAW